MKSQTTSQAQHAGLPAPVPQVAVVGCGYWGRNLVRVFNGLGALKSVCENDPLAVEVARGLAPAAAIEPDFAAVGHILE